jgi:outer membrane protein assembly factor BamB
MSETQKFANDPKRPPEGSLQVNSVLQGRFKITGVLGVGGMGSVYLARDMHFPTVNRQVAVKEMLNLASDPNLRDMTLRNFEREANILAELSHPAIPKIYDYFSSKDRAYLVMEYIVGKDLEVLINSQPDFLPYEMVRKWAIELCDVLSYLHTRPEPVVFRDVKPSNIMIEGQGSVRLIDFGIAKTFQMNQKGTMIGTEGYSPPEQYRGEASPAGDIYAVGATLHHVLTRRDPRLEPPFSFIERPIRGLNPKVPPEFETIVMRALAYEPSARFPSAAAMRDAMENLAKAQAAPAVVAPSTPALPQPYPPQPYPYPPQQGMMPPQGAYPGYPYPPQQGMVPPQGAYPGYPPPPNAPVPAESQGDLEPAVKPVWKFKVEDEIRGTPVVHKGMVYIGSYDNNLYALGAGDGSFKWKYATEGGIIGAPGVAVEENVIIFGSEDKSLYAIDMRTGKIAWTFQTGGPIRSSVTVASGLVFFGSDDGKLYAVRLSTGRLLWKYECGGPVRGRPAVTDERIMVGCETGDVVGLDTNGALKWRFKAKRAVTSAIIVHDDIAYMASLDWHIYAIEAKSGFRIWQFRTGKPVLSSPIIVGRNLYIGSADGNMYCLDVGVNGKELWRFETKGQIVSTPAFANGAVYFGCSDQRVYSIDTKKGKLRWYFETGAPVASSPTVVDGMLYIGSNDMYLYALNP